MGDLPLHVDGSTGAPDPEAAPVTIHIERAGLRRGLAVTPSGPAEGQRATEPLRAWLRTQPRWCGPGWVAVVVPRADVVERAFSVPGAVGGCRQLEQDAGLLWLTPEEWRRGVIHLMDWIERTRVALDEYLRARASSPQPDLFAGPVTEGRIGSRAGSEPSRTDWG